MRPSQTIVDGDALVVRNRASIASSMARMRSTEARIERSLHLLLYPVRGGSNDQHDSQDVRQRVLQFIARLPNGKPRVYAGPSKGGMKCDLCRRDILLGASEYEVDFDPVAFRLDRNCFALWHTEVERKKQAQERS